LKHFHASHYAICHLRSGTWTRVAHFDGEKWNRQSGIDMFEHSTVPFKDILRLLCVCILRDRVTS